MTIAIRTNALRACSGIALALALALAFFEFALTFTIATVSCRFR
jgi:hypothetical protein